MGNCKRNHLERMQRWNNRSKDPIIFHICFFPCFLCKLCLFVKSICSQFSVDVLIVLCLKRIFHFKSGLFGSDIKKVNFKALAANILMLQELLQK